MASLFIHFFSTASVATLFLLVLSSRYFAVSKKRRRTQMPVLESTDRAMPRSALRYRPIKSDADQQGKTGIAPMAQRASRLRTPQTEEDDQAPPGGASAYPHPKTP